MPKLRRTPKVFGASYRPEPRGSKRPTTSRLSLNWRPLSLVLVLLFILFGITRLPVFQIRSVTLNGATNEALKHDLDQLVGRSIFSPQIGRQTDHWLRNDPTLATLKCRRGIPNSLTCEAIARMPVFIWINQGREFLTDQNGRLYGQKTETTPPLPIIEDRAATSVQVGDEVASAQIIEQLLSLSRLLADRSIVASRLFMNDALYQPGAIVTQFSGPGGVVIQKELSILFVATQPLEAQVKTLDALLKERGDKVATRIDLRIPGYVYYH